MVAALALFFAPVDASAQPDVSIGVDYWSDYFWRGFSFYGDADSPRGVVLPWVRYGLRGFSLGIVGEIPEEKLAGNASTTEEAWVGVDFILGYTNSYFDDRLTVGSRVGYFLYPNSPHVNPDGSRNDFFEIAVWMQLDKILLKPKIEYSHYLRIDDRGGEQETFKDIYLRFSLSHDFEPYAGLRLTPRLSVAYFYYPSSEWWNDPANGGNGADYRGLSDIVAGVDLAARWLAPVGLHASFNIGFVPDKDFYRVWGENDRLHVWFTVGTSFDFP